MSDTSKARIAFVGAGQHATGSLYPNIPMIPEFDLVAVCDLEEAKAVRTAHVYGAEPFTDVDKMLDTVKPDGVCICGPANMHYLVSLQCLERGFRVFVEKPPAADLKRTIELVTAAEQNHTWGMVAFMKRFAPANLVAIEVMASEGFGKLMTVSLIHGCGPYDEAYRMMTTNGIHMIDLARFYGGDIVQVSAFLSDGQPKTKALLVNFNYASGAIGSLNINSGHHWQDCYEQAYLSGTGTAILVDASKAIEVMAADRRFASGKGLQLYGWSSKYYASGNMAGWWAGGHYTRGYWGELSHFARACLGLVPPTPSLKDGLEAMRFIEAAMVSGRENGRPVRLDEIIR